MPRAALLRRCLPGRDGALARGLFRFGSSLLLPLHPASPQYLADLYAVHADLERSMAQAAAALGSASPAAAASPSPLLCALRLFGPEQGLDRAGALLRDLQRIAARSQQQEQQRAAAAAGYGEDYAPPAPTQHAAALAAYLASLARLCRAAEGPAEEEQVGARVCCAWPRFPCQ